MRVVVCLPTYNERDNLGPMVRALDDVVRRHELDARVLVIDDSSPDGTGELADRLTGEFRFLSVLHRQKKEGLGPAYLAGFVWALATDADRIVEMDCDFSHDPEDLPRLLAATENADLALGSRYVEGGGTRNWSVARRAVSRFGSLYARILLGVGVRDLTGGFKCFRRSVLEAIGLERISTKGYAFQIETTYRALKVGSRVVEVPIVFSEREVGTSKMSRAIVLEAMAKVPALRLRALLGRL
ncbi:MAG TPA: polyprenol monophosphomannose synthase [Gaiellaceae bacterium]|nr:polyprenol monophosphomannose synthase [Gaiellaceae bacterium]